MRKLLIAVVVLLVVLVGLDRVAVVVATRMLDSRIEKELGAPVDTAIGGFPFLTSAVRRTLPEVHLNADRVRLGDADLTVTSLDAELRDVHVPSPSEATAKTFTARAVVPYSEVERRGNLAAGSLSATTEGLLQLTEKVDVLGRQVSVVVTGRTQREGDIVRVLPERVESSPAGIQLSSSVRDDISERLRLRLPLEDLPRGTRLADLETRPEGLVIRLEGTDVRLGQL